MAAASQRVLQPWLQPLAVPAVPAQCTNAGATFPEKMVRLCYKDALAGAEYNYCAGEHMRASFEFEHLPRDNQAAYGRSPGALLLTQQQHSGAPFLPHAGRSYSMHEYCHGTLMSQNTFPSVVNNAATFDSPGTRPPLTLQRPPLVSGLHSRCDTAESCFDTQVQGCSYLQACNCADDRRAGLC